MGWWRKVRRLVRRSRSRINFTGSSFGVPGLGESVYRRRKNLNSWLVMKYAAWLGLAGIVLGIIAFFGLFFWYSKDLPEPGEVIRREGFSSKIVDRNGEVLYDVFDNQRRVPVELAQMPEHLKQATIATEDKDFYKHSGLDLMTPFRIVYNVIFRQRVVGGSTLTQQLVKNVFLTNERTLSRKFKEFVLALQLERRFTKDQILELYLNEVPYGGTAYGVGAAAETYFKKDVKDLTLVEAAVLAGLPQRPSSYSPYAGKTDEDGTPLWKFRAQGVLRRMHEDKYLTDLAYEQAQSDLNNVAFAPPSGSIKAPHFVFYVQKQLEEIVGPTAMEQGGLTVTTSMDYNLQMEAEKVVEEEIEKVEPLNITNGSAVVMDPRTGEILCMVGSRDYFSEKIDGQFNVAVDGLRQPGSSIKPLTYLMMLRQGYTPATMLVDAPTSFAPNDSADAYEPKNYDGKFRGPVNLRDSLGSSLNVPAVKSLAMVGLPNFMAQAYEMGFVTLEPTKENQQRFGLSVTLGGAEVHLLDTVTAYSSFANYGEKVNPVAILKITNKDGQVLYEHRPVKGAEVISKEEAFLINNILSDNNARLMAFGANSLLNTGKPIAVKTGTTNDQRDNWTIGWSQEVLVGVWVGNNDNTAMKQVASGVTGASPIWRRIINKALESGYKAPDWPVPEGVEKVKVDAVSGYPEHDGYPAKEEWVIKGTLPTGSDPIHTKVKVCRGENKLATPSRVGSGDYDEKEFIVLKEEDPVSQDGKNRWQEGINSWIAGQGEEKYKVPTEYCGDANDVYIRMEKPSGDTTFANNDIEFLAIAEAGDGIEKVSIFVDGEEKAHQDGHRFEGKVNIPTGAHEVWAVAKSKSGKEASSGHARIGTGGSDWKKPEPSPSPSPSAGT